MSVCIKSFRIRWNLRAQVFCWASSPRAVLGSLERNHRCQRNHRNSPRSGETLPRRWCCPWRKATSYHPGQIPSCSCRIGLLPSRRCSIPKFCHKIGFWEEAGLGPRCRASSFEAWTLWRGRLEIQEILWAIEGLSLQEEHILADSCSHHKYSSSCSSYFSTFF